MRSEPGTAPECTVYYDMPFDDYCKLPGINASAVKGVGGCSPSHLRAYLAGEIERTDSPDMRFGRAMHCMILEPDRFDAAFPVAGRCSQLLASGEHKGQPCGANSSRMVGDSWRCGTHGKDGIEPSDFVTAGEKSRLVKLQERLRESPANQFLARLGYSECVIQWQQLGFTLKTRIDRLAHEPGRITLIDLKKMQVGKGGWEDCQKSCLNYGYHIATWFHLMAVRAAFGDSIAVESYLLFVEDSAPFGTHLLCVSDDDLEIADHQVVSRLSAYQRCLKSGKWFDYQLAINPEKRGILPPYYVKQMKGN